MTFNRQSSSQYDDDDVASTISARDYKCPSDLIATGTLGGVSHALTANGFDASEDGTGRGTPIIAFHCNAQVDQMNFDEHTTVALTCSQRAAVAHIDVVPTIRRLTPRECERLQGFSDDWTNIPAKVRVLLPEDSGPCAKRRVTATVVDTSGTHWVTFNHTMKPQTRCPRAGMSTGVGYELCRDVCQQPGHAEINAIKFAGDKARGATLYVSGHSYVCDDCMSAARKAGVSKVVVGHPPGDAKDGPRYKALGNSMAVPVINWIGRSIEMAEMGFWKA